MLRHAGLEARVAFLSLPVHPRKVSADPALALQAAAYPGTGSCSPSFSGVAREAGALYPASLRPSCSVWVHGGLAPPWTLAG